VRRYVLAEHVVRVEFEVSGDGVQGGDRLHVGGRGVQYLSLTAAALRNVRARAGRSNA